MRYLKWKRMRKSTNVEIHYQSNVHGKPRPKQSRSKAIDEQIKDLGNTIDSGFDWNDYKKRRRSRVGDK